MHKSLTKVLAVAAIGVFASTGAFAAAAPLNANHNNRVTQSNSGAREAHAKRTRHFLMVGWRQPKHQCHVLVRRTPKAAALVKADGTIVQGVYQQGADAGVLRNKHRPPDRVLQHGRTEFDAQRATVDG